MATAPTPRPASTRRTSSRSTARTRPGPRSRRRSPARRSSSTWATATAGRARTPTTRSTRPRTAWASTRRRATATTTTSTTASRTWPSSTSRPARSCCSTTCATRRATPSPATPSRASSRRPPARRQLRGRLPQGRRVGGHRRRPRRRRAPTSGRIFTTHQSIEDMWRTMPNRTATSSRSRPPGRPARPSTRTPTRPTSGFYRSLTVGTFGVTTDEVVSAGYGDTGVDPTSLVVPGNAAVVDRRRRPLQRPRHPGRLRARRCRPGRASASSSSRPRPPPTAGRWSRSRASTTRRSPATCVASDLAAKDSTAPGRPRPRPGRAVLAERRLVARQRVDPRPVHRVGRLEAAHPQRRRRPSLRDDRHRLDASPLAWDGKVGGDPVARRHLHRHRDRRRRLGQRRCDRHPQLVVDTQAPDLAIAHARRRHGPSGSRPTATASATRSA